MGSIAYRLKTIIAGKNPVAGRDTNFLSSTKKATSSAIKAKAGMVCRVDVNFKTKAAIFGYLLFASITPIGTAIAIDKNKEYKLSCRCCQVLNTIKELKLLKISIILFLFL